MLAGLAAHWYRLSVLTRLLVPVAFLFGLVVAMRRLLYRAHVLSSERVDVSVIVVGNINIGGSGKTPVVLWLAKYLAEQGWRPGIVSRGYGGRIASLGEAPAEVSIVSDPALVGDEPLLLSRRAGCPVWVGADRVAACRALRTHHPECNVLVLDDGLQHYRLARDVEIAVVDSRGFGNGHLFPAGPLREPVTRLASMDAVVCNGESGVAGFRMRLEGGEFVRLTDTGRALQARALGSNKVHAVAGIGDPWRFFRKLEALGLEVVPHAFPDHHAFCAADLDFADGLPVVMTEKDAVKCRSFAQPHFWMLPVTAEIDPAFGTLITHKLGTRKSGGPQAS
jgi:tetraacyldisaccharide 4'-kinase